MTPRTTPMRNPRNASSSVVAICSQSGPWAVPFAIHGIGLIIATAQATFNPHGVFAAMFILAVVALTAEVALTWLEGRLIKWRPNTITDVRI